MCDVKSSQRFTSSNPCPVCGGYDEAERGNGQRCFGFLSDDGTYAHCSREEFARDIALAEGSNTYAHYLGGRCRCGSNHGAPSFAQAAVGRPRERQRAQFSPERDTVFYYRDLSGTPIYAVVRLGGDKTKTKQAHKADGEWWWGLPSDRPKVPYRLPEVIQGIRDGKTIHCFEGEPDVDEARALGLIATTNLGGAGKFTADIAPYFLGADVVINADADKDGDKHRRDTPRKLMSVAKSIKVMPPFDGVGESGDFRDWIKNGGTVDKYLEMARAQPFYTAGAPRPVGTLIADVESRPYRWLWKPRFAFGKINIIDGDPGRGKSMLGLDIAARASSGNPMPDGTLGTRGAERLGVVLLSAEDDLEDTVRPRWLEAGGDETKLLHLFMFEDESGKERIVTIPNDIEVIERAVERMDAGVVIVDPLAAFWSPRVRTDADTEVRQALNPLKDMAERLDVAVILVRHLNKSGGANAIYRGAGSIGIIGAARSGILIGKHPEDDSIRVAAPSKINIAKEAPALTYTIASKSEDEPPKIIWGDEIDLRADELTRPPDEEKRSAFEDAQEWLSERLADGAEEYEVLEKKAKAAEIKIITLRRAKRSLGIESIKTGDGWSWRFPPRDDDKDDDGADQDDQGPVDNRQGYQNPVTQKRDHLDQLDEKDFVLQGNQDDHQGDQIDDHLDGNLASAGEFNSYAAEVTDAPAPPPHTGTKEYNSYDVETAETLTVPLQKDKKTGQGDQGDQIDDHLESPAKQSLFSQGDQDDQILGTRSLPAYYVSDKDSLSTLITNLAGHDTVAIDTETYPRDEHNSALDPRRGSVRLISVAAGPDVVGVVDTHRVDPRGLLESLSGKTLVAFNAKFDLSFLRRAFGYEHPGPVVDPCVLDVVLKFAGFVGERERYADSNGRQKKGFDPNRKHYRSLSAVAGEYLPDVTLSKEAQLSDWGAPDLSAKQIEYAAEDARVLVELAAALRSRFEGAGMLNVYELECGFTPALSYTQDNGFAIDTAGWLERCARQEEEIKQLKDACDALAPEVPEEAPFDEWAWTGSSFRRVGLALELLGAEVKRKRDTGNYMTGEAELGAIRRPEAAVELSRAILVYREAQKRLSTWGMSWFEVPTKGPQAKRFKKDHQFIVNGRVYSRFNQTVKTGRLSSDSPNFQNIPPEVRDHFIAPPGRQLVIGDYKQLEYVVLAILTQEDVLMDGFRRGDDVHVCVARTVFGIQGEVSKVVRKKAKEVSFGIVYGISSGGLATRLSRTTGTEFSKDDAQDLIDTYLDALPKVKLWYQTEKDLALSKNDVTKTMAGRQRLLDLTLSKRGKWYVEPSLRLNTPVQGSAGDGFKYATALAHGSKDECPGSPMIVNMVHDELVIEVDEDHVSDATEWLEKCMIDGMVEVLGKGARDLINVDMRDGKVWCEPAED